MKDFLDPASCRLCFNTMGGLPLGKGSAGKERIPRDTRTGRDDDQVALIDRISSMSGKPENGCFVNSALAPCSEAKEESLAEGYVVFV